MNVSDEDFETLEMYLDDELAVDQAQSLWKRLSNESELAQTLQSLRRERVQRIALWQAMEANAQEQLTLQRQLTRAVKRQSLLERVWRTGGISSAAAAILLVGFSMGRISNRAQTFAPQAMETSGTAPNSVLASSVGNTTPMMPGMAPAQNQMSVPVVRFTNAAGQVVGEGSFPSMQAANAFTTRFNQQTNSDDLVEPVSDTKY